MSLGGAPKSGEIRHIKACLKLGSLTVHCLEEPELGPEKEGTEKVCVYEGLN